MQGLQALLTEAVDLRHGPLRLVAVPGLGGSIAGLWHEDRPVLRSSEAGALDHPRQSACFPLVPYSNRLAHRRFKWGGHSYRTRPNFDDSPHSLHGTGWLRPWAVVDRGPAHLVLRYTHVPDGDWPFAFEALQRFALRDGGVDLVLEVTGTDERVQPVGLGWHPYFPKRPDSRLRMAVRSRWENDASHLPVREVAQLALDAPVEAMDWDHCFDGWDGTAVIQDRFFSLLLRSSLRRAVVFTPRARPHFCVEPVSHVNDAIHHADPLSQGLQALAQGGRAVASMSLEVARA